MALTIGQEPLYACLNHQQNLGAPLAGGDFTNIATNNAADGVFTLNGVLCDIDDIIFMADSSFDPVLDIDAGGIKCRENTPIYDSRNMYLADPLKTTMIEDGFTIVLEVFGAFEANASVNLSIQEGYSEVSYAVSSYSDTFIQPATGDGVITDPWVNDAVNKIAYTILDGSMAVSINGTAVVPTVGDAITALTSNIMISLGGMDIVRLRKFEIYEPVDDADLPSLSGL